jgi:aminocarboxymuconate-semialdehyde decarboxylase
MIIDMHNHVLAPGAIEAIERDPEAYGASVTRGPDGVALAFNDDLRGGHQTGSSTGRLFSDMTAAKQHLANIGADGAVMSTLTALHRYTLPIEQNVRLCRLLNDELSKWITGDPLLKGMATLPIPDGYAAAEELRRATVDLHLKGAMIGTNLETQEDNLDDPRLEPLWQAAQELEAPLFLHPTSPFAGGRRLAKWGLNQTLGNAIETTIAVASLIQSGVLDRYPDLKVVTAHGGGYFALAYGRLSHVFTTTTDGRGNETAASSSAESYLSRLYYDTILHRPQSLTYLINLVGADRVLFGTDYPYGNEPENPVRQVQSLPISEAQKETVLTNAARLYGFSDD